jgi:hypothetical protein
MILPIYQIYAHLSSHWSINLIIFLSTGIFLIWRILIFKKCLFFGGTGVWSKGIRFARQALYHWAVSPICKGS